ALVTGDDDLVILEGGRDTPGAQPLPDGRPGAVDIDVSEPGQAGQGSAPLSSQRRAGRTQLWIDCAPTAMFLRDRDSRFGLSIVRGHSASLWSRSQPRSPLDLT